MPLSRHPAGYQQDEKPAFSGCSRPPVLQASYFHSAEWSTRRETEACGFKH
jgi:hypothetical protein